MDVRRWMKHPVHTIKPLDSIQHAREVMVTHRVNQLPVVVDGRLIGIITDRDLRDAFPSVFDAPGFERRNAKTTSTDPRSVTVEMVMTPKVMIVGPGDSMIDAARVMRRERIGALPVVEAHRVVGIITRSDILNCFLDLAVLEDERESGGLVEAAANAAARVGATRGRTRRRGRRASGG
jgi:acetoin utilization protein AcuB